MRSTIGCLIIHRKRTGSSGACRVSEKLRGNDQGDDDLELVVLDLYDIIIDFGKRKLHGKGGAGL